MKCPQCGSPVKPNHKYCGSCAALLPQAQAPASRPLLPWSFGHFQTTGVLVGGIIVVLGFLYGGYSFLFPSRLTDESPGGVIATLIPTETLAPPETPTPLLNTAPGTILRPGEQWYRNGLGLQVSWDGNQQLTITVHNGTRTLLNLKELPMQMSALSPEGEATEQIVIHDPELPGLVRPGEFSSFPVALQVAKEQRAQWPYIIFVVEQFGEISNAQWELELINTPTPTLTPGPTRTPTPTPTPTVTPEPSPTTVPGTSLKDEETWYEDGLALKVDVISIDHNRLVVDIFLENLTDQTVVVYPTPHTFKMITNLGDVILPPNFVGRGLEFAGDTFKRPPVKIEPQQKVVLANRGPFAYDMTKPSLTAVVLEIVELGQIEIARWTIPIEH